MRDHLGGWIEVATEPKYPQSSMIHHDPEPLLSVINANVCEDGSECG